jgi:hypothetical protein
MSERLCIPIPADCKNVVSIASAEERAWERWRLAILRFRHDPTPANREATRHTKSMFEALCGESGG